MLICGVGLCRAWAGLAAGHFSATGLPVVRHCLFSVANQIQAHDLLLIRAYGRRFDFIELVIDGPCIFQSSPVASGNKLFFGSPSLPIGYWGLRSRDISLGPQLGRWPHVARRTTAEGDVCLQTLILDFRLIRRCNSCPHGVFIFPSSRQRHAYARTHTSTNKDGIHWLLALQQLLT